MEWVEKMTRSTKSIHNTIEMHGKPLKGHQKLHQLPNARPRHEIAPYQVGQPNTKPTCVAQRAPRFAPVL